MVFSVRLNALPSTRTGTRYFLAATASMREPLGAKAPPFCIILSAEIITIWDFLIWNMASTRSISGIWFLGTFATFFSSYGSLLVYFESSLIAWMFSFLSMATLESNSEFFRSESIKMIFQSFWTILLSELTTSSLSLWRSSFSDLIYSIRRVLIHFLSTFRPRASSQRGSDDILIRSFGIDSSSLGSEIPYSRSGSNFFYISNRYVIDFQFRVCDHFMANISEGVDVREVGGDSVCEFANFKIGFIFW